MKEVKTRTLLGINGRFLRGNVHSHSSLSDGSLSPYDLAAWYADAGYDFLSITDHDWMDGASTASRHQSPRLLLLRGAELHPRMTPHGDPWHLIVVGINDDLEVSRFRTDPEGLMAELEASGAWVAVAHPSGQMVTATDIMDLGHVDAIEIYNEHSLYWDLKVDSWPICDELAARGRLLGAVAVDDCHFQGPVDYGRAWIMVDAAERTSHSILGAMKSCMYYASQGPKFHQISVAVDTLLVSSSPCDAIVVTGIGQKVEVLMGSSVEFAEIPLKAFGGGPFRVTLRDALGRHAWSNYFQMREE